MSTDFAALRRRFPVLERKTYLNSGSYCALAESVRDAINAYMDDRLAGGADWGGWGMEKGAGGTGTAREVGGAKNEAVRTAMAAVLRAAPDEIAVTASASAGLNALASAFDFKGPRN